MASSDIVPAFQAVDPRSWVFSDVKKNAVGSGSLRIKKSSTNSQAPAFILDRMRTPFGIEEPLAEEGKPQNTESTRRNLTVNVENPELQAWLSSLDDHLITWVTANSTTLFNRVIKRSTVEDVIYYRSLRPAKGEYSPTFRVKVNIHGQNQTKFLINIPGTTNFFQGNADDVLRGSEIVPTVLAYNLWVTANQIGITFIATHLLVFQPALAPSNPFKGYTEVPRPVPTLGAAAPASSSGTGAAPASSSGAAAAPAFEDDSRFDYEDPTSMF